jgi:hypothetical protein
MQLSFLLNDCDIPRTAIIDHPILLSLSLIARMRPRHAVCTLRETPVTATRLKISDARFADLMKLTNDEYAAIKASFVRQAGSADGLRDQSHTTGGPPE